MQTPPPIQNFDEKEPYIYASYASEDTAKVFPILERLQSDGFRLWYYDNTDADRAQIKAARAKLKHAMFFLAFLSPSYLQSVVCQKEFGAGQAKDFSKCILIHIENAELDTASTFFFARAQNVRWYMSEDNEPLCYYVLYEVGNLDKCNIHGNVPSIPLASVYGEDASASGGTLPQTGDTQINTDRIKKLSFLFMGIAILIAAFLLFRS